MSIVEIFDKGGPVVWILAGYSVIALAIVIDRYIHFFLMGRAPGDIEEYTRSVTRFDTTAENGRPSRGPESAMLEAMAGASRQGVKDLASVAARVGSQELIRMERGLRTLGFLGATAPLLGLFGTITGMIKAFMVIEQAGGKVDAQALASGIWEAMVTTGVGLAVSIPILFLLHVLEGMVDRRSHSMKQAASLALEKLPHRQEPVIGELTPQHEEVMDGV